MFFFFGKMEQHRKIELQGVDDLSYLITNVRRAAADSINAAFPPLNNDNTSGAGGGGGPVEEDELRVQIERMVTDYIERTFTLAAPNLTINGLPVDLGHYFSPNGQPPTQAQIEEVVEYEPFDARKRQRVEELAREEEDLLRSIAALKRKVPKNTATTWAEATKKGIQEDEDALQKAKQKITPPPPIQIDDGGSGLLGIKELDRQQDMEASFKQTVETLGKLKRDMPSTVAKMERARVAGVYVITEKR
ncbi:hypothetical protein QBC46DRAFT_382961 [Diplogelasinospora grovesii]|uniref:Kinetochore protein mis14 n=1 Tax=Diplogelasinospora grovesii TaxID=303347 RepID=A0AAN6S4Z8_9PEZI|nr:hypothetical protein QBC46DRAFT_382961 [Diplogelasinospora grovesii]